MSIIEPDTPLAKELGFTSDKFEGWLGEKGGYIYISFIISLQSGKGHLSELFKNIQKRGYGIKVPTPFSQMKAIIRKKGFHKTMEPFAPEHGINESCEVWVLDPITENTTDSATEGEV